jgi:hypothetical protein
MHELLRILNQLRDMPRSSRFHSPDGLDHSCEPAMVVCATFTTTSHLPASLLLLLSTGAAHG